MARGGLSSISILKFLIMFAFLFALLMGFATPNHTTPKDCGNSGTVTTFGDPPPTPGDHGGETGNNPPRR